MKYAAQPANRHEHHQVYVLEHRVDGGRRARMRRAAESDSAFPLRPTSPARRALTSRRANIADAHEDSARHAAEHDDGRTDAGGDALHLQPGNRSGTRKRRAGGKPDDECSPHAPAFA
jgi:hypothetical protein